MIKLENNYNKTYPLVRHLVQLEVDYILTSKVPVFNRINVKQTTGRLIYLFI